MDYLIHLGNLLIFASFAVVDILWLRLLQVIASAAFIGYFVAHDLLAPVIWNVAFIGVNVGHSIRLIRARRPIALTSEQERLYLRTFRSISRREFLALVSRGEWRDAAAGELLVEQGEPLAQLILVTHGRVSVRVGEAEVARLGAGNFVGEMSFITGHPPSASVCATERLRAIVWSASDLHRFLDGARELKVKLERIIGADVIDKLRVQHDGLDLTLVRSVNGKLRR